WLWLGSLRRGGCRGVIRGPRGPRLYSGMGRGAGRQRVRGGGKVMDWVVGRNRLSIMGSRNRRLIETGLHELAGRLGFRFSDGFAERIVYREFFPRGLSALGGIDETTLGTRPTDAHPTARPGVEAPPRSLQL